MSIQTESMRETDQRYVTTLQRANGSWSGVEYINHPTPSGCERWLPTYSDNREWPDSETAKTKLQEMLYEN